ncbi:MAG: hypothetical protein EP329_24250 [Deltaproteobacteria bacterium]|nr:MAG: hypothetical protein EP329_24250 [Deltaproteobacteria bacterium]
MRAGDKGDKKGKKAPQVEAAPVPEKAMEAPGEAMASLGSAYLGRFVATLQSAGGNTAVQTELTGLKEGHGAAGKAKADMIAFKAMTDGQKVAHLAEKNGGQLPESKGKEAPAEGAAPKGMEEPAAVVGFHAQRSAQLAQLATAYSAMQGRAMQLAAMAGLDPESQAAFGQAAAYFAGVGTEYMGLSATYAAVGADLAANEYAALAAPPATAGAMYQERLAILQEQQTALREAAAAQLEKAVAAEAEAAAKDAEIADMAKQQAEASKASEGGGAGAPASSGPQLERMRQARQALSMKKERANQLAAALAQQASGMDQLLGAYNAILGGADAAPTGRPEGGGGK